MIKYSKILVLGFAEQRHDRAQFFGRMILYAIIVYLFHQIFTSVNAGHERLWYYAITEAIILSAPTLVLTIAGDIRCQQIVYFLVSPISYCTFRIFESLGIAFFRYICLIALGFACCSLFVGFIPNLRMEGILAGFVGIYLYTLISSAIGLSSFWLKDVKTFLYLNLTATFCFGGLIVPLSFYDPLMRTICFCTPYPWILWWPAALATGEKVDPLISFISISFWIITLIAFNQFLFHRYQKKFLMEGG